MVGTARRLGILDIVVQTPRPSDALIVVADGDPEDRVLLVLAKVVNGARVVNTAFPEYKEFSVFDVLGEYIGQGYSRIAVIIDQERYELEQLVHEIRERVSR